MTPMHTPRKIDWSEQEFTEMRPGNYVFNDFSQVNLGGSTYYIR